MCTVRRSTNWHTLLIISIVISLASAACQPNGVVPQPNDNGTSEDCTTPPCDGIPDESTGDIEAAGVVVSNDNCADAEVVSNDVIVGFDLTTATTDGPPHASCTSQGSDQLVQDVWLCWTSNCSGLAVASTCGRSEVDTRIAIYAGCACPVEDSRLLNCVDDSCGVQTRAVFPAEPGAQFLVRIGMFAGSTPGVGSVEFRCGLAGCPGEESCESANASSGCDDAACCDTVCAVDPVCCSERWDEYCVAEAAGLCGGGFRSCTAANNNCLSLSSEPGCENSDCCETVCRVDPYCCIAEWDETCRNLEATHCFGACQDSADDCSVSHALPGCSDMGCCEQVCPRDPFCCTTSWDAGCTALASQFCTELH